MDDMVAVNALMGMKVMPLEEEPVKEVISCYAVGDDDRIAVCMGTQEGRNIAIYSRDKEYLYGYYVHCPGQIGLEWKDENLCVWIQKKHMILIVAPDATIMRARFVRDIPENKEYWEQVVMTTEKSMGNYQYSCEEEQKYVRTSYWKTLLRTDEQGQTGIIYEADYVPPVTDYRPTLLWMALIAVGCVGIAVFIYWRFVPYKKK